MLLIGFIIAVVVLVIAAGLGLLWFKSGVWIVQAIKNRSGMSPWEKRRRWNEQVARARQARAERELTHH
jgi:hypothetical protein